MPKKLNFQQQTRHHHRRRHKAANLQ